MDKLAIPFYLPPEDHSGSISELISRINDKTEDYNTVQQVHGLGGYRISANIIMQSDIGPSTALFVQLGSRLSNASFGRVEFNPAKIIAGGLLSDLEAELECLSHDSYHEWVHNRKVSRVDIAVDIKNVNINELLVISKGFSVWSNQGKGAGFESRYLGSVTSKKRIAVYDKRRQLIETNHQDPGHELTRIEVRLKSPALADSSIANLINMENPFKDLSIYYLPHCEKISHAFDDPEWWRLFFDSCRLRGAHGALLMLPPNKRKMVKKALEKGRLKCWDTEKIWSNWNASVHALLEGSW